MLGGGLSVEAVEVRVAVRLGSFNPIAHGHRGGGGQGRGVVTRAHGPGEASRARVRRVGAVAGHGGNA